MRRALILSTSLTARAMTTTAKIAVDGTAKSAPFAVAIETGAEPSHLTSKEWLAKTPFAAYEGRAEMPQPGRGDAVAAM